MDQDDEPLPQSAELPLEFRLGSRLVIAKKAELLDPRRTLYRLELKRPPFLPLIQPVIALCPWIQTHWPEWFLPPIVILKKQKDGWKEEFSKEKQAYDLLKPIQGTVIPYFYGEAVYDASPALVLSAIAGTTLFELAREEFPQSEDEILQEHQEKALEALWSYGVEYTDQKLDNFFATDDSRRVMDIDFELVEFDNTKVWEKSINHAGVLSLMDDYKNTREPNRMPPASIFSPPDK